MPTLKLIKPAQQSNAIQDEDVAELVRINEAITLMITIRDDYKNALILKKDAGARMRLREFDWNNGEPRRIVRAKAAGGGT